jgi:hypothetical protein
VPETLQDWSALATILALPFGIWAVFYAGRQFRLSRKAESASALISLNVSFRDCWLAFLTSSDEAQKQYSFADLANTLETACAIHRDNVFFGASKDLLEHYLVGVFLAIEGSPDATDRLLRLLEAQSTFENIRKFLQRHRDELSCIRNVAVV